MTKKAILFYFCGSFMYGKKTDHFPDPDNTIPKDEFKYSNLFRTALHNLV